MRLRNRSVTATSKRNHEILDDLLFNERLSILFGGSWCKDVSYPLLDALPNQLDRHGEVLIGDLLAMQLRGSMNMASAEPEQCAICMEHTMEAAIQECSHEVCTALQPSCCTVMPQFWTANTSKPALLLFSMEHMMEAAIHECSHEMCTPLQPACCIVMP